MLTFLTILTDFVRLILFVTKLFITFKLCFLQTVPTQSGKHYSLFVGRPSMFLWMNLRPLKLCLRYKGGN